MNINTLINPVHSNNLRDELRKLIDTKNVSLYNIEMQTGVHRQIIKNFLNGRNLVYENGMTLKFFLENNNNTTN